MGKTNPTYRDHVRKWREDTDRFRRALRRERQESFDELRNHADQVAHAGMYYNSTNPTETILLSICTCQQHQIRQLRQRVDDLEEDTA
ncbi:hypothetical protein [Haloarchaeobius sp. DYHT-AS-18]|uniref:hypothetical protein n=1 Tax=Haloarchaeobius sp. DYHT-AS-18 TaxID=3446117 RepID=UPI003EC11646